MLINHLEKLLSFKTIAEAGTLRAASGILNLTQPSLTRLIQTLEAETGKELFHRSKKGMLLTEAGKILYDFAAETLRSLDDFEQRLKHPKLDMAGVLNIGSYETLAEYFWPSFMLEARKNHPELILNIKTSSVVSFSSALERGSLDILVDAEPRLTQDFTSWLLYEDEFSLFGKGDTLIYCPAVFDRNDRSLLSLVDEHYSHRIELDSFTAVATFAEKGLGTAILPKRLGNSRAKLKPRGKSFGKHGIYATVHASREKDRKLRSFMSLLKVWFKEKN